MSLSDLGKQSRSIERKPFRSLDHAWSVQPSRSASAYEQSQGASRSSRSTACESKPMKAAFFIRTPIRCRRLFIQPAMATASVGPAPDLRAPSVCGPRSLSSAKAASAISAIEGRWARCSRTTGLTGSSASARTRLSSCPISASASASPCRPDHHGRRVPAELYDPWRNRVRPIHRRAGCGCREYPWQRQDAASGHASRRRPFQKFG